MSKKAIKSGIPGKKVRGLFGDRCLKVLSENKDKVVVVFLDGKELAGFVKGVGDYTFLFRYGSGRSVDF